MSDDGDFADADWREVYERQRQRGAMVDRTVDGLGLDADDAVLDVGSGPGYPAIRLAERVAPGAVYALDRRPGALRYCVRAAAERGVENVHPVCTDARALGLQFGAPTPVRLAFVLHHVDDPAAAIGSIARAVPAGSPLLVLEYHPDGAGAFGPPVGARHSPERVRAWLEGAGFLVEAVERHPEEQYSVRARRA